jgi:hypothetical protein
MRATLLSRLERLEAVTPWIHTQCIFRYGWLHPLPSEFIGERHVVIVKRESTASPNIEVCEFEERAGPAPSNCNDEGFCVCLTR